MAITFKNFFNCLPFITSIKKPVLLRARHGVGKSTIVYDYAKSINMPVIERRASQMTEGDLLGLPKVDGNVTTWLPPDWLMQACNNSVVLFIDEIDRATHEVRQGFFELTDSRKIAGWKLHEDTLIFAAVNGGEHSSQYQVGEMDPAELDRWTVFDLEPSIEDWLLWAKENCSPIVWDFINNNHQHLEHNKDFEPNKVYPSRRSWHRLSDCILKGNLVNADNKKENNTLLYNISTSFIGFEGAIAFCDFVKAYEYQLTPEDIINKGKIEKTKDYSINEHLSLIEKMNVDKWWENVLTKKQIINIANYFCSILPEIAIKLWTDISTSNIKNAIALHANEKVSDYLVQILRTKIEEEKKEKEEEKK